MLFASFDPNSTIFGQWSMAVTLRARLVSSFDVPRIRHFTLAVRRGWGVLASLVPQQALDLNSQEVWATATVEQCVATTRTERWKFTCRELESNHPQSVIIFHCSRAPREFSVVDRRDIIRRTPRQHIGFVNQANALEIDQPDCATMQKNVRGLAVTPNPTGRMQL